MQQNPIQEWTSERVAELKGHWDDPSLSMSQIGKAMGLTRNAVIGKIHRLGWEGRTPKPLPDITESARKRNERRARAARNRKLARRIQLGERKMQEPRVVEDVSVVSLVPEIVAPPADRLPTADLRPLSNKGPNQCRFIADEPPGPQYLACANETEPGKSYCPACWKITHGYVTEASPFRRAA